MRKQTEFSRNYFSRQLYLVIPEGDFDGEDTLEFLYDDGVAVDEGYFLLFEDTHEQSILKLILEKDQGEKKTSLRH